MKRNTQSFVSLLLEAKTKSSKRSPRKRAKVQKYVEESESDGESSSKKENTSSENSSFFEQNQKNDTDKEDEQTEESSSEWFPSFVEIEYLAHMLE